MRIKGFWLVILLFCCAGGLLIALRRPPAPTSEAAQRSILPTLAPTPLRTSTATITSTPTLTPPAPPTLAPAPTLVPTRTFTPSPTLPTSAEIKGIYGYGQLFPLSCEARSAADWARHFEIEIREIKFLALLPLSTNPEEGFVGSINGSWGQTPPESYGVHAGPVAEVLRSYGASAVAVRNMTFTALKRELAEGQPVITWVTGHVAPGRGIPYEVDGRTITVAAYEHTVIVIGYNDQKKQLTILDGKQVYERPYAVFFRSWDALENMAVIWED